MTGSSVPAAPASPTGRPARLKQARTADTATVKLRVLHVEDNPIDAMRARQMLSRARSIKAEVETVPSLSVALERLGQIGFDVVLLDLNLPDSEGLETFSSLSCASPATPVVVLTSAAEEALGMAAVQLGAQDFLLKSHLGPESVARSLRCAVERHRLVRSLRGLSLTDDLTGLLNRRGFTTLAIGHLRLGSRTGSKFLLFFVDLDGLKQINDTHGHHQGDEAIVRAAEVLRLTFRESDLVARFAGDEFAVLALDSSGDGGATVRARMAANLERENTVKQLPYRLAASVGIVGFESGPTTNLQEILERADAALYAEKRLRREIPAD